MKQLFKRSVAMFLLAVMVFGYIAMAPLPKAKVSAVSTNLLADYNFSFETAQSGTVKPANWYLYSGASTRATISAEQQSEGGYSLKIDNKTSPGVIGVFSAYVPVTPGDVITLSMDVMGDGVNRGAFLRFFADDSQQGNSNNYLLSKDVWTKATSWTTVSCTATVPDGAKFARVLLWAGSSDGKGVFYYDNIVLSKKVPLAEQPWNKDNMLVDRNGDFETLKTGSTKLPSHWTLNDTAATSDRGTVVTDPTNVNNKCLKLDTETVPVETDSPTAAYSVYFPVAEGDIVTATVDAMGTGQHGFYLRFYTSEGGTLLGNHDAWKTGGDQWGTITIQSKAPARAKVAQVWLYVGKAKAVHYYDNAAVEVFAASEHQMTHVPAKPASTTEAGNIEYWSCQCGKLFADSVHSVLINDLADVIIPMLVIDKNNMLSPYNHSFEGASVAGLPNGWTERGNSRTSMSIVTGDASDGNKALVFDVTGKEDSPRGIFSEYLPLDETMKYLTIMLDFKGEGNTMIYTYYYDANKKDIGHVSGDRGWTQEDPLPTWSTMFLKSPVPEGAVYVRIMIYRPQTSPGKTYIDNVIVKEFQSGDGPARPTVLRDSFESGANRFELPWGWSHYTSVTQNTATMKYLELIDVTAGNLPEGAPKTAVDGTHYLAFTQVAEGQLMRGIYSPYIDITGMKGVYAGIDICGKGESNLYIMFYDENYKCPENTTWRVSVTETATEDWTTMSVEAVIPEGAKYARILLNKSFRGTYLGTVYLDKAVLMETEVFMPNVVPEVGELVEHDWQIAEAGHPRTYFNLLELRRIKKFSINETLTSMGYSGSEAYADLISEAEGYLKETKMVKTWGTSGVYVTYITFPVYPVLEDPSCREEFMYWPTTGAKSGAYPYMTNTTMALMERMQTLALAYAISGDVRYGERAVQYAKDMSKWKYWVGEWETIINSTTYHELSAQPTGYCVTGVATVYDICFDLLSESDKKLIENALIEKALEPMYHDCMPRMLRGRDMDHMATTYIGCCAIINEENKDQLAKYLNMVMLYTDWIFDWYDAGHNEGYDYAANGVDQLVEGMGIMTRTTGMEGNFEHPFFTGNLREWIIAGIETYNGTHVGYSDSPYITEFERTMCVMAQRGDSTMGYLLSRAGGTEKAIWKLIYTKISDDNIIRPESDYMNTVVVEEMGVGSLRTGWGSMDKLMFLLSDDYGVDHAHWEANSIYFAMSGWRIKDVGYGSITPGLPKTIFDMRYAANTIFLDGKPQNKKGGGSVSEVVNGELYGQILGEARKAFGKIDGEYVLNKFDRNVIMMNHDSETYYVVIDDLSAPKEHIYGFNMYHSGWDRLELDGKVFDTSVATMGNHLALLRGGTVLHYEFAGAPLEFKGESYIQGNEVYGPMIRVNSELAKDYQFMTVISTDPSYDGIIAINEAVEKMTARSSKQQHEDPEGWSWSSSNDSGQVVALPMGSQYGVNMFRAREVGDWMSFVFHVEEENTYRFSLKLGSFNQYNGTWQAYLDGEPIGEPYYAKSNKNAVIIVPMGDIHLTAGKHTIKMELIGDIETKDKDWGTLISMGVVVLELGDSDLGYGDTKIMESYDDENTLGVRIRYGTVLEDIILTTRGNGTISGGKLVSDGQQASVMGLYEEDVKEGYALINGTTMKYGDMNLVSANNAVTVTVDYRLAKVPIKNKDDDKPLTLDEDFDYDKPTTLVTATTAEAQKLSIYVGNDAPYTVLFNEQIIASTYADGVLTFDIPAGDSRFEIVGTHHCIYDQHSTNILNVKTWADCEHATEYYVSCYCGKNGTETFLFGEPKEHKLTKVAAKEATQNENGNIEFYKCRNCNKYYADANGTQELKESDVIILSNGAQTWLIIGIVAGVLVLVGVGTILLLRFKFGFFVKKKEKEETVETVGDETKEE